MSKDYPWYSIVGPADGLEQGDIVFSCPILEPIEDNEKDQITANLLSYDVIIMSQSCDLANEKLKIVIVCPFWPLDVFESIEEQFKSKKNKEHLRKGHQPNYHLLNSCNLDEKFDANFLVVDFRSIFGVPYTTLKKLAIKTERRIRLLSPYKEHLAQAFARFFMRVGLPTDIESFI